MKQCSQSQGKESHVKDKKGHVQKKQRLTSDEDGTSFRVSCKLAGKPKHKLDLKVHVLLVILILNRTVLKVYFSVLEQICM